MKLTGVPFYPANPSNFTRGRGRAIRFITIHHSAGWENTLRYLWADPNRNGSSHFWVGNKAGQIEQYVDTADTAYTNGNWYSNEESITIEVRGDWRGYYNQATLDNLETLLKKLRKAYPTVGISYHKDVSDRITLCPADLKDKGYAKKVWDNVTKWLNPPKPPAPSKPKVTYTPIKPKRIKIKHTASLWDFNFTSWAKAKAVKTYGAGHIVDVVAVATNSLGGKYYMTAYSYNDGKIRATHGFNQVDCVDYVPVITKPPVVGIRWEKMQTPRKMLTDIDLYVTDLDTMKTVGAIVKAGTPVDFVEKTTTKDSVMWLRSKWARDNSKNWGIRIDHLNELTEVPEPPREPIPEPPIQVDPETPTDADVVNRLNALELIVKAITDFLDKTFNNWRK